MQNLPAGVVSVRRDGVLFCEVLFHRDATDYRIMRIVLQLDLVFAADNIQKNETHAKKNAPLLACGPKILFTQSIAVRRTSGKNLGHT